jgi:TonB family protein
MGTSGFKSLLNPNLLLIVSFIIAIFLISCGRKNSNKMSYDVLPSIFPPEPPKPPSMTGSDTIWNFAGKTPILPGNKEALFDYIGRHLKYPESAKIKGIQGRVVVKFCVTRSGKVTDHEVIISVSPDLDTEALRVIKTITVFEPGYLDGKPVAVWYEVPVSFRLQ